MDTLSRLLSLYTIRTSLDIRCELAAPWVLDEPAATPGVAPFHVVVEGGARVDVPGHDSLDLAPGDVVVFPGGSAHRLHAGAAADAAPVRPLAGDGPLQRHGNGGPGPGTAILCGSFVFEGAARAALVRALPDVMVVRASRADDFPGLHALVRLLQHETASVRPGADVVVAQLSGALFALLLRAWLAGTRHDAPGLFAVLADRRLGNALQRMLESPERAWKVEDLAAACHMSRATFARLFSRLCGMPPADMLTRLRMAHAARVLLQGEGAMGDVAQAVGYQSEAAFNRVFKRHYGVGPGTWRRTARAAAMAPVAA
ncbi:AraC family transcriptional regulator [Massilia luteola]|uniref:AraC family transcriptional regulator n=1 Tax=Massilia luteola TaxID=3081751 RepID=UPI002ACBDF05|nr:AraC family transcriptional regulator [Massilia sp. Gc5]